MNKFLKVIVNLFDGEGAGTSPAAASEGSSNNGATTSINDTTKISTEVKSRAKEIGVPDDLVEDYQKAFDSKKSKDETKKSGTEKTENEADDYESLVKGKFKANYDADVQKIISDRLGKHKQELAQLQQQTQLDNEIFNVLSQKYKGIDINDRKALLEAVKNDNDVYKQMALDNGITTEEAKSQFENQQKEQKTTAELEQLRREHSARQLEAKLQSLSESTKQVYPDFDLQAEMQNPDFQAALDFVASRNRQQNERTGKNNEIFNLTKAYEMAHADEIRNQTVKKVGSAAMSAFAQNVAANGVRPKENVATKGNAPAEKKSIRDYSDSEFDDLVNKIKSGQAKIPR